jgi:serine protease AprX
MNRARKMIGLDRAIENTLTGKGVAIAVMDTGIAPHPDLERHRIAFTDYINGHTQPYDDNGHGTHIAGIIAGNGRASNGRYKGIAPESSLYCMKVLDAQGNGNSGLLAQALSDLIEIYQRRNIRIVNISVGSMPGKAKANDAAGRYGMGQRTCDRYGSRQYRSGQGECNVSGHP